jgi:hypothetical protein
VNTRTFGKLVFNEIRRDTWTHEDVNRYIVLDCTGSGWRATGYPTQLFTKVCKTPENALRELVRILTRDAHERMHEALALEKLTGIQTLSARERMSAVQALSASLPEDT